MTKKQDIYPDFIHACGHAPDQKPIVFGHEYIYFICDLSKGGCGTTITGPSIDAGPEEYWDWAEPHPNIIITGEIKMDSEE